MVTGSGTAHRRLQRLKDQREAIQDLVRSHKGRSVAVVGSVARGDDTADSDIDLLVEFEPASSLLDLIALEAALEDLLGTQVDVISAGALLDRDVDIRRDAVALVSRSDTRRLADMLMAADEINNITARGRTAFDADVALRRAVERCLEIVGEAGKSSVRRGTSPASGRSLDVDGEDPRSPQPPLPSHRPRSVVDCRNDRHSRTCRSTATHAGQLSPTYADNRLDRRKLLPILPMSARPSRPVGRTAQR